MTQRLDKEFKIKIKCPLCGVEEEISVKTKDVIENPAGIVRIPIEHQNPIPHILVLDIDSNGFIRGAYLIKRYIDIENVPIRDTILAVGLKNFARIIGWILGGYNIVFRGSDEQLIRNLKAMLRFIFGEIAMKNANKVLLDPLNVKELPYSVELIERNINSALRSIADDKALMSYIKNEISKYANTIEKLMEYLNSTKERVTFNELKQRVGSELSDYELKFLIAILTFIDPKMRKKIDMPEVRITDLF